jgi:ribonuclease HI
MPPRPKVVSGVSWEEKQEHLAAIQAVLKDSSTWVTFTDGSALHNPGPGGAAALIVLTQFDRTQFDRTQFDKTQSDKTQFDNKHADDNRIGDATVESKVYVAVARATNNQMELKGLDLALDLLQKHDQKEARSKWVVFTDSDYLCGLFERGHSAHKNQEIVAGLRKRISTLSQERGVNIRLQWVRAHCGISYNEQVDKLSRDAAKQCQAKLPAESSSKPKTNNTKPPIRLNHVRKHPSLFSNKSPPPQPPPSLSGQKRPNSARSDTLPASSAKRQCLTK